MLSRLLRWLGGGGRKPRGRSRRRRIGPLGCLLWLLALVILVLVLSALFGGFQKGTKVGIGAPAPASLTVTG
jgi:hypothetical protein